MKDGDLLKVAKCSLGMMRGAGECWVGETTKNITWNENEYFVFIKNKGI